MSIMNRLGEKGGIVEIVIPVVLGLLLLVVGGVAVWAYQGRQDYKDNVDQKVAVAVQGAQKQQIDADNIKFAEAEKQPLRTYKSPSALGSIVINYPKTWSAYVDETGHSTAVLDSYFHPNIVPSIGDKNSAFALHVQLVSQSYSDVIRSLADQQTSGKITAAPFSLKLVPSVVGVRTDGQISQNKTGSIIYLPLRDKTLEISTEAPQYINDFNNNILPNLTFSP